MEPMCIDSSADMSPEIEIKQLPQLDRQQNLLLSSLNGMKQLKENRRIVVEDVLKMFESDHVLLNIVKEPWHKFVDSNLIICVAVKNEYNHVICDAQLFINNDCFDEVETRICNINSTLFRVCTKNEIQANGTAYVVGIINVHDFRNLFDYCPLSCSILFKISDNGGNISEKELTLPPLHIKVEHLINGNMGLFNSIDNLSDDVFLCTVISDIVVLEIHLKGIVQMDYLHCMLINDFHLTEVNILPDNYLYYVMKPSKHLLHGFVVRIDIVSESVVSVICYPRSVNQIKVFKHSLYVLLQDKVLKICEKEEKFAVESLSVLTAVNALSDEFKSFTDSLIMAFSDTTVPIKEEKSVKFTAEVWNKLIDSNKMLKTDLAIQKLSSVRDDL